jgi:hypothetical protein
MSDIKHAEYRALVEAGPAVVMVAKADMLKLLDRLKAAEKGNRALCKLTDDQVREILSIRSTDVALAGLYGVTPPTIRKIRLGFSYRHVEREK